MNHSCPEDWPQFFTATINNWQYLLSDNKHKDIITGSLRFLVENERIVLYAFVIMSNHLHLIWQPLAGYSVLAIRASFMKYTAQQLKKYLTNTNNDLLEVFRSNKYDRNYQFWKRDPLSVELRTRSVFMQKLAYIHFNPVRAGLCSFPEEYYYSSAGFYHDGKDDFNMLTHYSGN